MSNITKQFSSEFAKYFNASYAFSFWKARVAMYAILKACNVGENDEVILPGYTCVMNVNPIKYLGAKPVYVDIEPITYNINVDLLKEKITDKTKIIVAQHTYGYPCPMDEIMNIAQQHGITVIEDCCLGLGAKYKGKSVGTFGKAAYFSFQWSKIFTTGLGGMAITSDKDLAQSIRNICNDLLCQPSSKAVLMLSTQRLIYQLFIYPRTTSLATSLFRWMTKKGLVVGSSSASEYVPEMDDDFFMAMGNAQARVGLRQMNKIDKNISHRKKMRKLYDKLLTQAGFNVPTIPDYMDPVLVRYPLLVDDKDKILIEAPSYGVEIGSWYECPLHPIETPLHLYDYQQGMCPQAEKVSLHVVNLPLHPRANEKTAQRSVDFIRRFTKST